MRVRLSSTFPLLLLLADISANGDSCFLMWRLLFLHWSSLWWTVDRSWLFCLSRLLFGRNVKILFCDRFTGCCSPPSVWLFVDPVWLPNSVCLFRIQVFPVIMTNWVIIPNNRVSFCQSFRSAYRFFFFGFNFGA